MNLCMEDTYGTPNGGDPYEKYIGLLVAFTMLAAFVAGVMDTLIGQVAR